MNDMQQLLTLANSLAKFAEDNEKISLPLFSVKLAQAQQSYPSDYTIGMMSAIVGKMANKDKLFISRAEVKDLYDRFYSRGNKFAAVFGEELGQPAVISEPTPVPQVDTSIVDLIQQEYEAAVDPVLASALDKAFGGNTVKEYSKSLAKQAVSICNNRMKDLGFTVQSEVLCGKDNILMCNVAFETPRGTTSVLVPVETANGRVQYSPSVFVGNTGSQELTKDALVAYLTSQTGNKLTVQTAEVLNAVLLATRSEQEVSDVDLAFIKMNAAKTASSEYSAPQIMGIELDQINPNLIVEVPVTQDPQFESIARTFDSELGFANFKFGSKVVQQGHQLIKRQLQDAGLSAHNVAVASCTDDAIQYSVAINGGSVAFTVPVKIESGSVLPPTILLCNGSIKSFDKSSLVFLVQLEGFDRVAASNASPLYGIKPSELVAIVRTAVAEGNLTKAEDALNVLANGNDDKAYSIAMNVFEAGLKPHQTPQVEAVKCAMVIKSKHSQYDTCGHTGLPLHKVYQDKQGHCQPLYRQAMTDSYEGVNLSQNKVFI